MAAILIIEDEPVLTHQLSLALSGAGHEVQTADTLADGLARAEVESPDLVLLDLRLPDGSGLDLIGSLRALDDEIQIVLMTAYGSPRDAVEAMRRGAADYLQKPLDMGELGVLIQRLLAKRGIERELAYHRAKPQALPDGVLDRDPRLVEAMARFDRLCDAAARPSQRPPILISGEQGSGKSLVGLALHRRLGGGAFLDVGEPPDESEALDGLIFGRERSAQHPVSRPGLVEAAEGGTLLVRDVERLSAEQQERLLEAISEKRVRRFGGRRRRQTDVQIIATTTVDLAERARCGEFAFELYERFGIVEIHIPPLRERPGDVEQLALHFACELGRRYGNVARRISREGLSLLSSYEWPGNVSELRNIIERLVLTNSALELGEKEIGPLLAPGPFRDRRGFELPESGIDLETVERELILQALERTGGNQTRASALLGLSRDTLRYRVQKWGIPSSSLAGIK